MDLHYKQEITVGALVLAGIAVFVIGTMWLRGRSFTGANRVVVAFSDVGNLKRGTPVKVSGVTLGSVEGIAFEDVGRVLVTMSLASRISPKADASVTMVPVGLVGDVAMNFDPGKAAEPLPAGRVIEGRVATGFTELGAELGGQAKQVLSNVEALTNQRLAEDLHNTLTALQRMLALYSDRDRGPTAEMTRTMVAFQQLSARLDSTLANPSLDRAVGNLDSLTANLAGLSRQMTATGARLDSVLAKVNQGQGTMGRFVTDSAVFVEMRDLMRSLRNLTDSLQAAPGKLTVQFKVF